jgi:hypothetical protein
MSWQKYFTVVPQAQLLSQRLERASRDAFQGSSAFGNKFSSYLPEVYSGSPNRMERYVQYDQMDQDSDVNAALDTVADFCTQKEDRNELPFNIRYTDDATDTEVDILKTTLRQWCDLNQFGRRIWRIFRSTLKYGDQFFIRDPETFQWEWIDPNNVDGLTVNEMESKKPISYMVRNLDLNMQSLVATTTTAGANYGGLTTGNPSLSAAAGRRGIPYTPSAFGGSSTKGGKVSSYMTYEVDASHVVHLSLSEGIDPNWPFGNSILENIFKTYKQKELLEDSVIIYRVQRAPERRVFYIDVGNMPVHRAMAHLERVKQEIHQRRIPNRTGGGTCLILNIKVSLLDGRNLELSELISEYEQGKQNWTYSCDPNTGAIVPGKITWAGETRKQTQVVKLTLDNGETITVTPDHKFPILGKGFVQAQHLEIGESFIPAYFRNIPLEGNPKGNDYRQIFDNESKEWKFVHRMVGNFFKSLGGKRNIIEEYSYNPKYSNNTKNTLHHIDFNRYNNNPENLAWMASKDHYKYHSDNASDHFKYAWSKPEYVEKMKDRHMQYNDTLFIMMVDIIKSQKNNSSLAIRRAAKVLTENIEFMTYFQKIQTADFKSKTQYFSYQKILKILELHGYNSWTEFRDELVQNGECKIDYSLYHFSERIFELFTNHYMNSVASNIDEIIEKLKNDEEFTLEFDYIHTDSRAGRELSICAAYIDDMMKHFGFKNFREFRKNNPNPNYTAKGRDFTGLYKFTPKMFNIFKQYYAKRLATLHYTQTEVGFTKLYQEVQKDPEFKNEFSNVNSWTTKSRIGPEMITVMLKSFGFKDYFDFREKYPYLNHKLVSIEWLEEKMDTGTITVDGDELYHGFHNFALSAGVFTQNSIMDAAYSPLSIMEDYFFAQTSDGRGSKVETLPGGENLGQIDDLRFFQNKIFRGLRIPIAYIPTGPEEGSNVFTDGRVGTAYIQEFRFSVYCERLQSLIDWVFDKEFKLFVKLRGVDIESKIFKLNFNKPENFGRYRQIELDSAQLGLVQNLFEVPFLSKRYVMERYMGMTQEEILTNERKWREENPTKVKSGGELSGAGTGLGAIGVRSSGMPSGPGGGGEFGGLEGGAPLEAGPGGGGEIPPGTELATNTPPPGAPPGGPG